MSDETVTILKTRWIELIKSERLLTALEAAGVDNWEGFSQAQEILSEMEDGISSTEGESN